MHGHFIVESKGDSLVIGGVIGGLAVFALVCVIVIVGGIIFWYRSVYDMTHSIIKVPEKYEDEVKV